MKFDIYEIISKGKIQNEYELEKALAIDRKLRILSKKDPELKGLRIQLRDLIKEYEKDHWSELENVSDRRVRESDRAEIIIELERQFVMERKELIRQRLKELKLKQQELASVLGHSKTYMSQLMNGVCPFSMIDLIKIHHLLKIPITDLVLTILPLREVTKIKRSVSRLKKATLSIDDQVALSYKQSEVVST